MLVTFALVVQAANASPQGGNIVGGSGTINQSGVTTAINQNSAALAINWNSYNLGRNEIVNYIQPNASSIALNRIVGGSASQIHGQINANGHVVLVNPSGIFFGQSSSINVGGLIASGLDVSPIDFMNGDFVFRGIDGSAGAVTNAGLINASLGGSVSLLGKRVGNEGLITANLGAVNLAAGNAAVLTFDRQGLIGVRVTEAILQQEMGVDPAVLNSGEIKAESGRVLLTASQSQDVFSAAVNSSGIEQATSVVVNADGSFTLGGGGELVNSGNVDVSSAANANAGQIVMLGENLTNRGGVHADAEQGKGGQIELHSNDTTLVTEGSVISAASRTGEGGEIKLLGDKVGLFGASRVDASGASGGGEILIGGDYRGQNQRIRNAAATYIGRDVMVDTSAGLSGDGGRIIVWGNDSARVFGGLSARGGSQSGDGGFIETSAAYVELDLSADVGAANGAVGTWLIDPFNISIESTCGACTPAIETTPGAVFDSEFTPDPAVSDSVLTTTALLATLTGGATVLVETTGIGGVAEPAGGNITLVDDLDLRDSTINGNRASLTLRAEHNISIDAMISDSTPSDDNINLTLQANSNGMAGGDVIINDIIITEGGAFAASGDNIIINAAGSVATLNNSITLTANTNGVIRLDGDIDTGGGIFTAQGAVASTGVSYTTTALETPSIVTNGGSVNIGVSSNVDILGTVNTNGGGVTIQGQNITLTDAQIDTSNGAVAFTGAGFTSTRNNAGEIIDTNGGSVTMNMAGAIDIGAEIETDGGAFTVIGSASFDNDDANGLIDTSDPAGAGVVSIISAGNVVLGDFDISSNNVSGAGITVDSGANITLARTYNFDGTDRSSLTFNADNDVNIAALIVDPLPGGANDTQNIVLNADRDDNGAGSVNITADIYTAGGDFTVTGVNFNQGGQLLNTDDRQATQSSTSSNGGDVLLTMSGGVTLGTVVTDTDGAADCGCIEGNLTITAMGGDIIDSAGETLSINANTVITAGSNNVILDEDHDFDSSGTGLRSVSIVSANNVTLNDANDIALGRSTIGGTLNVTANGSGGIVQTGALNVFGVTTLAAVDNDITLENGSNNFSSVGSSGAIVRLRDIDDIVLGVSTITDQLFVTAGAGGVGTIAQSGALSVTNDATFEAVGGDITLVNANNLFSTVMTTGNNVRLRDFDNIDLGSSAILGNLAVIASGDITNSGGPLFVGDAAGFTAGNGNDIVINDPTNQINGSLSFIGAGGMLGNVTLLNGLATDLGFMSQITNLGVASGGAITQSGVISVTGFTQLNAAANDITLENLVNNFNTLAVVGRDVSIIDLNAISLNSATVSGDFDVTANGAGTITQSGGLTVAGDARFVALGDSITLTNSANDFASAGFVGGNVSVRDDNSIALSASAVTGTFDVEVDNDITSNGALNLNGAATFTGRNGSSITINDSANQLAGTLAFSGAGGTLASLAVSNTLVIDMPSLNLSNDLVLTSPAGIIQSGTLTVNGNTSLTSIGNNITFDDPANNFSSLSAAGADVEIADATGINLSGANVTGNYNVDAGGAISQSGSLLVSGAAVFGATGNSITLENAGNNFSTINVDGSVVSIRDDTGLDFATNLGASSTVSVSLDVIADGDVRFNPGSIDALGASVNMTTSQGNFLGLDLADVDFNPDIIASSANFVSLAGTFGSAGRLLTFEVAPPGEITILSRGFFLPLCRGPCIVNASGIDFGILASIAANLGDQLVDIESLGDIDPAIFTELKNYSGEEVSILLPKDQLYEDELEEQN